MAKLAIVGRPNVGKSTLFNAIIGQRRSIVGDEPGITRDRLYGEAEWLGHEFRVVDTGGIIPDDKDFIPSEIFRQAKVAFEEAAAIVMVVDARIPTSRIRCSGNFIRSECGIYFRYRPSMAAASTICWTRSCA